MKGNIDYSLYDLIQGKEDGLNLPIADVSNATSSGAGNFFI